MGHASPFLPRLCPEVMEAPTAGGQVPLSSQISWEDLRHGVSGKLCAVIPVWRADGDGGNGEKKQPRQPGE